MTFFARRRALWWASYAAASTAATVAGALGFRTAAGATKPIPLALLAFRLADQPNVGKLDQLLIGGALTMSAIGDGWMFAEEFATDPDVADRNLQVGASSFGAAQIFYSSTLLRRGAKFRRSQMLPRLAVMGEPAGVLAAFRPRVLKVLGPYGSLLATMSGLAASTGSRRMAAGGIIFQASDIAIINRRHLLKERTARIAAEAWVLGSYFTAQALLIDGLLDPRSAKRSPTPDTSTSAD